VAGNGAPPLLFKDWSIWMRMIAPAILALAPVWASAPAIAQSEQMREISGTLTYLQRIALAPEALVVVEARGLRDVLLGQVAFEAGGAQVPLAFALGVPADVAVRLTATLGAEGGPQWAAGPVVIGPQMTDAGDIVLAPGGLPFAMLCGDLPVTARYDGSGMELATPRGDLRLGEVAAASGARFEAEGDPSTWFWSKGEVATLSLFGEELPECVMRPAAYVAQGNEPFWSFAVAGSGFTLTTPEGVQAEGEVPAAAWRDGAVEWVLPVAGLRVRMVEAICRDTMTGMPYPETVTIETAEGLLEGCGGDPVTLLEGAEWVIEEIAGLGVIEASPLTLNFREGGNVGGMGGCNRYSAGFTLSGEGLSIGPAAATMMACEEPLMRLEQALFQALPAVTRFDIADSGALMLYGPEDAPLVVARRRE
jgi:heat shock protein HslJ